MTLSAASQRLDRVRADLAGHGLDGLLVSHLPNVRYLTGFTGSNGWLAVGERQAVFITDGRYEQQAEEELAADAGIDIVVLRELFQEGLAERIAGAFGRATIGFEGPYLSYANWTRLVERCRGVNWKARTGLVEKLRAVKDEEEIAAIGTAAAIAAEALQEALSLVEPGISEVDIASELDYRMVRLGASGPAFETIVASGPRTALPHAATGQRNVCEGDLLLCDFGARWNGYCSDLSRTFVIGQTTQRQTETYTAVLEAQHAAFAALRAGATGAEVDAATRESFARRGLEDRFSHSTGHGLGLEVHEGPRLGRRAEEPLESGMVVTVEPGLYFPGWGGVRIEDDVVITEGRPNPVVELESDHLRVLPG
jgi:Xaa-Pro aminopeptidase